ncbi:MULTISPECIES: hypothetical protein [Pseudomonas]|jgi:hypothetical protein|uniref:Uncharacterized protein n=1 Tax=Pseudomonas putida TaxID=303 RepID=A0A379KLX6_PSEPU|nr:MULTISPECIES: hypothetical protein [Pseudomonas]MBG6127078.1 hypothetical protein [Pseudomonas sp. M2]NSX23167.1 hypothetical protein [Pseudomonas putida]RRV43532.1 hypothetical protein EGJ09_20355 [Pseudomonas sp. p106]SUD68861.1 Uncharacterised protein [Pseudomonas putida]HDS1748643.1 hypothetical protein [Pseudomonas putida]
MHHAAQDHNRRSLNEAEAFAEEMRNLRASSPWTGVLLFYLGAISTGVLLIAGMLVLRSL